MEDPIAFLEDRDIWQEAKNPETSQERLEQLLTHKKARIRNEAGKHPNVSPHFLFSLGIRCPSSIWLNPAWTLWLLAEPALLEKVHNEVLRALLSTKWARKELIVEFLPGSIEAPKDFLLPPLLRKVLLSLSLVRVILAKAKDTPKAVQKALLKSLHSQVKT